LHNGIQREGKRVAVHEAVELNPATGSRQVKVAVGVERRRCGSVRHTHGPGKRRSRHLERVKPNVRSVGGVEVDTERSGARRAKTGNVRPGRVAKTGRFVLADGGVNAINADDTADSEDGVIGWVNDVQVSALRSDSHLNCPFDRQVKNTRHEGRENRKAEASKGGAGCTGFTVAFGTTRRSCNEIAVFQNL